MFLDESVVEKKTTLQSNKILRLNISPGPYEYLNSPAFALKQGNNELQVVPWYWFLTGHWS